MHDTRTQSIAKIRIRRVDPRTRIVDERNPVDGNRDRELVAVGMAPVTQLADMAASQGEGKRTGAPDEQAIEVAQANRAAEPDLPRPPECDVFAIDREGREPFELLDEIAETLALDVATGAKRRVTDHPVGLTDGVPTLDGEGVRAKD